MPNASEILHLFKLLEEIVLEPFSKDIYSAIDGKEHMFIGSLKDIMAKGTYHTITDGDKRVGVVGYENGKKEPFATIGIIKEFRGKRYLAKAYKALAAKHGLKRIYIDVEASNKKSLEAHKAVGFKDIVDDVPRKRLYKTDVRMYKDF